MVETGGTRVRAAVVGTGLIGGSILLRLAAAGLDVRGWDPDSGTRQYARQQGLDVADELVDAVRDRDVVFLCGPLPSLCDTLVTVAKATRDDCVITDVGSAKTQVAEFALESGLAHRFVPGHPMAGSERAGLPAASTDLFQGAAWVLCPSPEVSIGRFRALTRLIIEVFEARIAPMSPYVHDSVVALASHIPHLVANSLAGAVARAPLREAVIGLAAGSFRDGTRVAGTPSRRTADMLINNRDFVLRQIESVYAFLADLSTALRDDDVAMLTAHLATARGLREELADRRLTTSTQQFPDSAPGADELDFLLALGESGGLVTGCALADASVTYAVLRPE